MVLMHLHLPFFFLTDDIFSQPLFGSNPRTSNYHSGETWNAVGHGPRVGRGPHHHHCHRHPAVQEVRSCACFIVSVFSHNALCVLEVKLQWHCSVYRFLSVASGIVMRHALLCHTSKLLTHQPVTSNFLTIIYSVTEGNQGLPYF